MVPSSSTQRNNGRSGGKAIEAAFKGHKSMKHVFIVDDDIDKYTLPRTKSNGLWQHVSELDKNMIMNGTETSARSVIRHGYSDDM